MVKAETTEYISSAKPHHVEGRETWNPWSPKSQLNCKISRTHIVAHQWYKSLTRIALVVAGKLGSCSAAVFVVPTDAWLDFLEGATQLGTGLLC
jgi:hypothetical protein